MFIVYGNVYSADTYYDDIILIPVDILKNLVRYGNDR